MPVGNLGTGKGFGGLIRRLTKLGVAGVANERPDGPLVEAMPDAGLRVVVITPRQVRRAAQPLWDGWGQVGCCRCPAGWMLRTDGHRLQPLCPDSDATQVLRALSRTRKDLQKARVALCNQLQAQLERCFPGAVGLFADLHSATAIAFLGRYPTSQAAATLTQAKLAAFLRRIHYCGRTRSRCWSGSRPHQRPTSAPTRRWPSVCVAALLDAIQACHGRERELEAEIIERLELHADQAVFTSLPKAGRGIRAAALVSEIGDVRTRFPDEEALALAGVALVTRASGKLRSVGFRWACDEEAARCGDRLRRRLPPRLPVGGQGLRRRAGPDPPPPPGRPHPGSAPDPGHLAHLARPHQL